MQLPLTEADTLFAELLQDLPPETAQMARDFKAFVGRVSVACGEIPGLMPTPLGRRLPAGQPPPQQATSACGDSCPLSAGAPLPRSLLLPSRGLFTRHLRPGRHAEQQHLAQGPHVIR